MMINTVGRCFERLKCKDKTHEWNCLWVAPALIGPYQWKKKNVSAWGSWLEKSLNRKWTLGFRLGRKLLQLWNNASDFICNINYVLVFASCVYEKGIFKWKLTHLMLLILLQYKFIGSWRYLPNSRRAFSSWKR